MHTSFTLTVLGARMYYEHDRSIATQTKSLVVRKIDPLGFSMASLDPVSEVPAIDPQVAAAISLVWRSPLELFPERAAWDAQFLGYSLALHSMGKNS
jgi:hypothetical protein